MKLRQTLLIAGVITVGIFTVARMRAQNPRMAEDYVQRRIDDDEKRMDRIDTHLDHVDATAQEHTRDLTKVEEDFIRIEAQNHDEDVKWHEGIVGAITVCTAALRFLGRRKPTAHS